MFKPLALTVVAVAAFAPAWAATPAAAAPPAATAAPTDEQLMTQFRDDLQAASADIVAKGITLTGDQAAKFWPLFKQYQAEQAAIIDAQLKATEKYANSTANLTEADSLAYVGALLDRDQKIHDLRVKWLTKFQTVVPAGTAARVVQIDRRLGLVAQIKLASKIPLVH
jgi:Spy/CpxP family protein refolding chaperone